MKKTRSDRFRAFDFATCPFYGSPYRPEDIIFLILSELRICRLIKCSDCGTVYCVQRAREVLVPG